MKFEEPFEATFRTFEAMLPYWNFEANGRQYCDENGYDCVKVLAPVPSYEEWKASYNCMLENEVLRLKNAQLKELLRECKIYVENFIEGSTLINEHHISYILLQRIKEVLK